VKIGVTRTAKTLIAWKLLKELITQTLIGKRISKQFEKGIYLGTITSTWIDDDHHQYWRIRYDDEDGEDLNLKEIREALTLYKLYPNKYLFGDHATSGAFQVDVGLEITFRLRCACYTCNYAYSAIPRDKENSLKNYQELNHIIMTIGIHSIEPPWVPICSIHTYQTKYRCWCA
jgi:hypothetical protein